MKRELLQIVIDTNVFISALYSKKGASFKLLFDTDFKDFEINLSVPLILEYEKIAKNQIERLGLPVDAIDSILDMICRVGNRRDIFFLWRPFLRDPKDDHILEVAIESQSKYIITYNISDFRGIDQFGIQAISPKEFLILIGEMK